MGFIVNNAVLGSESTLRFSLSSATAGIYSAEIRAKCGDNHVLVASGLDFGEDNSVSATWIAPIEWASLNTEGTSVDVNFTISLVDMALAGASFDTYTATQTYVIPSTLGPTVNLTLSDTSGYFSQYGSYIQNKSVLGYSIAAEGAYGSTITGYTVTYVVTTPYVYGGPSPTTYIIQNDSISEAEGSLPTPKAGTAKITVYACDSRGYKGYYTANVTITEYSIPTSSITSAYRCDADGSNNDAGEYASVTFNAKACRISTDATITYKINYRPSGTAIAYTTVNVTALQNTTDVQGHTEIIPVDAAYDYNVYIAVSDSLSKTTSAVKVIPSANVLVELDKENKAMGIGASADTAETLRIGLDTVFLGKTNLDTYKRNLLDNSDFTNPVNQRGITEINTSDTTPFIDRWLVRPTGQISESSLYLYNRGNKCDSVTGGYSEGKGGGGVLTWNDSSLYLGYTGSSGRHSFVYTNNKIDITEYKTLRVVYSNVTVSGTNSHGVAVGAITDAQTDAHYVDTLVSACAASSTIEDKSLNTSGDVEYSLDVDISSLTGAHCIEILATVSKITIHEIYLIKDLGGAHAEVNNGGYVQVESGQLIQRLETYKPGTTYTYVACKSDGVRRLGVGKFDKTSTFLKLIDNVPTFILPEGSWAWAALYEDSYSFDTLPSYQPKGYGTELMECYRYYRRFASSTADTFIMPGRSSSDKKSIYAYFPVDPPMRTLPTVEITGGVIVRTTTNANIGEAKSSSPYKTPICTANDARVTNLAISKMDGTVWNSASANYGYIVSLAADSTIELSAEL